MVDRGKLLVSAALWLLGMGAQVGGYTNAVLAAILFGAAVFFLLWATLHWLSGAIKKLQPIYLLLVGLGGLWVFATIALAGIVWQQLAPRSATSVIEANSINPITAPAAEGVKLRLAYHRGINKPEEIIRKGVQDFYSLNITLPGKDGAPNVTGHVLFLLYDHSLTFKNKMDLKYIGEKTVPYEIKQFGIQYSVIGFSGDLAGTTLDIDIH